MAADRPTTTATRKERKALLLRLPPDMHLDLRMLALFTDQSVNEIITSLVGDYLGGPGRELIERGMTARAQASYKDALDKLAEV
jgi:hypothetical protein